MTDRPTRVQTILWMAIVIVALAISLSNYHAFQLGTWADDASYVVLARSLISGNQYGQINEPGAPAPTRFPFGFPLLITPLVLFMPGRLDAPKVLSLIATVVNVVLLFWGWRWLSRKRSYWWALAVAGLYALCPLTIDQSRMVMSEPLFTTFCLVGLILAEQAVQGQRGRWWSLAMASALVLAVFTRTVGVVVIVVVLISFAASRRRSLWPGMATAAVLMIVLVGVIVAATPVSLHDILPVEYLSTYMRAPTAEAPDEVEAAMLREGRERSTIEAAQEQQSGRERLRLFILGTMWGIKHHLAYDLRGIAVPFGAGAAERKLIAWLNLPELPVVLGFVVSGLIFVGWIRLLVQEGMAGFLLFPILYFGLLSLWAWVGTRLLYPIIPHIHLGLLVGLEGAALTVGALARRPVWAARVAGALVVCLVLVLAAGSTHASAKLGDSREHAGDLQARVRWLAANTSPDDVIMTELPASDYLYSGRRTVPYPLPFSPAKQVDAYLVEKGVRYVLIAPALRWQETYQPAYNPWATRLLALLTAPEAANRISVVHSSDAELIKVFRVGP